jgi:hypothetical protein
MFKELKNHLSSLVGFVMPARPASFFKERFPTRHNVLDLSYLKGRGLS